jgi:hypothetical protein
MDSDPAAPRDGADRWPGPESLPPVTAPYPSAYPVDGQSWVAAHPTPPSPYPPPGPATYPQVPTPTYQSPGTAYPPTGPTGYPQPYGQGVVQLAGNQGGTNVQAIVAWVLTALTLGYFLPWAIAATRGKTNSAAIGVLNLLLGWTFIGWIVALVMACGAHQVAPQMFVQQNVAVQFPNQYMPPPGPVPPFQAPSAYGYPGLGPQGPGPQVPPYGPSRQ